MDIFLFKILKTPVPMLGEIETMELERKMKDSGNDKNLTSIIDFNLSDIKYVAMDMITVEGEDVYSDDKTLSVMTFPEFIDWVNKYDNGTFYMGWNCGWYDIPHIKYELVKTGLVVPKKCNLLDMKKYQDYPVYDLKEKLFSYGYSSSMLLTLSGLGIDYRYFDYKKMFEQDDNDIYAEYITEYVKNIKNIFIKAKGVLI